LSESGYRDFLWYPRRTNQFSKKDLVGIAVAREQVIPRKRLKYRVFCLTAGWGVQRLSEARPPLI